MKKIYVLLFFLLFLHACNVSDTDALNNSISFSKDSVNSILSESQSIDIEFNVVGKFICSNNYYNSQVVYNIPSITFNNGNSCVFVVNYLEGGADINGTYKREGNEITVELNFQGTIFENNLDEFTGEKYIEEQFIFTIVDEDKVAIDKNCYAVEAGDLFIRQI